MSDTEQGSPSGKGEKSNTKIVMEKEWTEEQEQEFESGIELLAASPLFFFAFLSLITVIIKWSYVLADRTTDGSLSSDVNEVLLSTHAWNIFVWPVVILFISFCWFGFVNVRIIKKENNIMLTKPFWGVVGVLVCTFFYCFAFWKLDAFDYRITTVFFPLYIVYSVNNFYSGSKPWFIWTTYAITFLGGLATMHSIVSGVCFFRFDFLGDLWSDSISYKYLKLSVLEFAMLGALFTVSSNKIFSYMKKIAMKFFSGLAYVFGPAK